MAYNFKKNTPKNNGVDDMTLISKVSEDEITSNLKKRFMNDSIYTYIGPVLISVNPFRLIPQLYGNDMIESYKEKFPYENPPHIYALAEQAYRAMQHDQESQCVLITGESGAGKTECSKLIMQYIAAVSGNDQGVSKVKRIILESNPLLEAFGNAKTLRNNNSSRFGKYFEIQFDRSGNPCGGRITNYLLEKSRVVYQQAGERNFHIFYQICAGLSDQERKQYGITKADNFFYTSMGGALTVPGMNDAEEFAATRTAMKEIGLTQQEQDAVMRLTAGILWLGNVQFKPQGENAAVADKQALQWASRLLGVLPDSLERAMLFRIITTGGIGRRGSTYNVPQNPQQASYIRDALAKSCYDRLFSWLVQRINQAFPNTERNPLIIGVLDIYGFEIFDKNSFEQLCINYVNEKLQQIFIDLTLKAEQEEYNAEGIQWTPIKFFNNKVVCDLIEETKPPGLFAILDDTCNTTHGMESSKADEKFAQRMNDCTQNQYYIGRTGNFVIKHYAGDVCYSIDGITDKNKDQLFNTLIECVQSTQDPFIRALFPENLKDEGSDRKRPTTAGFKIKKSCNELVAALRKCTPHYIRCIKPNETKQPKDWDNDRVSHQVKYLGLLENVRVRRAGFAYRHFFEKFVEKFCILSKKTWPGPYRGDAIKGCEAILTDAGVAREEYQFGKTKIFLRHPETLFGLEEAKDRKYQDSASMIARTWRSYRLRRYYAELRSSATNLLQNSKERRRLSINRVYQGDYINYPSNAQVQEIMKPYKNEGGVLFADVLYVPHKKALKPITIDKIFMLVTSKAMYFIGKEKVKKQVLTQLIYRLSWDQLQEINMSQLCDNYICIKPVASLKQPDMFGECNNKTELLGIVNDQMKAILKRDVTRTFNNAINFTYGAKMKKGQATFTKNPKESVAKLAGAEGKWKVDIAEGLPPTTQPKVSNVPKRQAPSSSSSSSSGPKKFNAGLPSFQSVPAQEQEYESKQYKTPQYAHEAPSMPVMPQISKAGGPAQGQYAASPAAAAAASRAKPAPPPPKRDTRPKVKALYDYDAAAGDELTLRVGDIVAIVRKDPSGWYEGEKDGKVGLFPGNYVEDI